MRTLPALFAASFLTLNSAAQQVWIVDDTAATAPDFTDLQTAIGTVADGDVLLVRAGTYPRMVVTAKALTIAAYPGEAPVIDARTTTGADRNLVSAIPAGKSVQLIGLELRDTQTDPALMLQGCAGTVWVEDCRVIADFDRAGIAVSACASVALLGVTAIGGAGTDCGFVSQSPKPALDVFDASSVHAYGCDFEGTNGNFNDRCFPCVDGRIGGTGVRVVDAASTLVLAGCRVVGGRSECNVDVCDLSPSPQPGGTGLQVLAGDVHVIDSTLEGGPGSFNWWGSPAEPCDGPVGPAYTGIIELHTGRTLRVTSLGAARDDQSVALHVEGPPHVLVRLGASDRPTTMPYLDLLRGTLLLDTSVAQAATTLGITNASGVLDATLVVGPLPPLADAQATFYQLYHLDYDGFRLRRFGEALDTFVLGQGTMLLGIDASF
jgi:hypothetical protein